MKAKAALVQGALALAGLGAAYATWQKPPSRSPGEVVLMDPGRRQIAEVRFEDGDHWVTLKPAEQGDQPVVWMHLHHWPSGVRFQQKPAEPTPPVDQDLLGNDSAEDVLAHLSPLLASRALGTLSPKRLGELGLASSKQHLVVTASGEKRTFTVSTAASGRSEPYLQDERDGQVYLVEGPLVSDLLAPRMMIDRRLHLFSPDAFDAVTVKANGKSRTFTATEQGSRYLPVLAADGATNQLAKSWHDKLWRVATLQALGRGEVPPAGPPQLQFRVDYGHAGGSVGWTEVARSGGEYFARSEHTAGWVRLAGPIEALVKDAQKLAAGG